MGFDFTGDNGLEFQLRSSAWSFLLYVAESYDWDRQGTLPPPGVAPAQWCGEYASNDGQRVTAADANALADAFEAFLRTQPSKSGPLRSVACSTKTCANLPSVMESTFPRTRPNGVSMRESCGSSSSS